MASTTNIRIELTAARALAEWENVFADEVRQVARQIACDDGNRKLVTYSDYQQAATLALQKLATAIANKPAVSSNGHQKVA